MNKLLGQHLNLENRWLWGLVKEETKTTIDFLKLNDELNPKIWDDQSQLKSQVRIKLLKIAKKFIQFLDMPQVTITDIQFTGSMANYNYSSYSDIDLHILIQYPEDCDNSLKELAQSKKMLWNKEHDIQIYNHQVELYPQDINEPHTTSGLYSVLKNEWIKVPVHREFQIDVDQILTKVRSWNTIIDEADTVEAVNDIKNRIKKMRKSGLEEGGEYSIENLTFKVLRNWGSIEKLNAIKLDKTDKELSLQEGILDEKTLSGTKAKQAYSQSNKTGGYGHKQPGGSDARARKRAEKARNRRIERDANAKQHQAKTDKIKMGYEEPEKTWTDTIKDKLGMNPSQPEPSSREFDEDAMKRSTKYQKKKKKSSGKDRKDKGKSDTKRPPKPQQQLKKKERPETGLTVYNGDLAPVDNEPKFPEVQQTEEPTQAQPDDTQQDQGQQQPEMTEIQKIIRRMAELIAMAPNSDSVDVIYNNIDDHIERNMQKYLGKEQKEKGKEEDNDIEKPLGPPANSKLKNESFTDQLLGGDVAALASAISKVFSPSRIVKKFFSTVWTAWEEHNAEKRKQKIEEMEEELRKLEERLKEFKKLLLQLKQIIKKKFEEKSKDRKEFEYFWQDFMEELINPLIENMQEVIENVKEAISAYKSEDEEALKKVADKLHIKNGEDQEEDEQVNQDENAKDASQEQGNQKEEKNSDKEPKEKE